MDQGEGGTPEPVQRFVDAINQADTEAFVEAFSPDGYVDDWGRVLSGRDGVRSWAGSDAIGMQAQMTLLSVQVDGNEVTTRFSWTSNRFDGESTGIFVLDGEAIASFTIPPHR